MITGNNNEEDDLIIHAKIELEWAMRHCANAASDFDELDFKSAAKEIKKQIGDMFCAANLLKKRLDGSEVRANLKELINTEK